MSDPVLAPTVYHHFRRLEAMLQKLRPAFSRGATFMWFCAHVLGQICRRDARGVSSDVRALGLDANSYDSLIRLFRSKAWSADRLRRAWYSLLAGLGCLLTYADRLVLCSDGCKLTKEGERMPGVKRQHQDSETVSKPEFMFGYLFGCVGVLIGVPGACHCVPMKMNVQDGLRAAAGWEGAAEAGISGETHVVQSVRSAFEAARGLGRRCLLAMDRYFLAAPALRVLVEENARAAADGLGEGLVHIVTRAKSTFVGYEPPAPRPRGKRGRPPKRGHRVDVGRNARRLLYHEVTALVGGEEHALLAATLDLVWGKGVWAPVRVVVVLGLGTRKPQILVTTDLTLSAREVIECYAMRWHIECAFRDMKVELLGLAFRFWSRSVPRLDRFAKRGAPDRLESVTDPADRAAVLAAAEAIERYVACSCVALGLLQILANSEREDGPVARAVFRRTFRLAAVSVVSLREYLRDRVSGAIGGMRASEMMRFIRDHQVGPEGYAPRPSQVAPAGGR